MAENKLTQNKIHPTLATEQKVDVPEEEVEAQEENFADKTLFDSAEPAQE